MQSFYQDMHERMRSNGRDPEQSVIMPQLEVVIGETESIAREKAEYLNSLIDPELVAAMQSSSIGVDLSKPVADLGEVAQTRGNQGMQGSIDRVQSTMKKDGVGFAEAARKTQRDMIVGTPKSVADQMQDLFESRACDGFVVSQMVVPTSLEQFCRSVVPELQHRGILRREYRGKTLRENILMTPRA
jgi:alkanesulfonate monooxygenase SsuD/methylene tetrahydromethanopterin reductase-like flavin-dependent oxidoreductase (luciferase family)